MYKCLSAERSSHLNDETEPRIKLCGGGDPHRNVLVEKGHHTWISNLSKKGSVYPTGHLCVVLHFLIFLPVFGKESTDPVGQNASLVINILQNILGPHHEIPDLVAWWRPVYVPLQLFFHFFSQDILRNWKLRILFFIGINYLISLSFFSWLRGFLL